MAFSVGDEGPRLPPQCPRCNRFLQPAPGWWIHVPCQATLRIRARRDGTWDVHLVPDAVVELNRSLAPLAQRP